MRLGWRQLRPVANATAATYALTAADVGSRMRFRVVAPNGDGSHGDVQPDHGGRVDRPR
jgi:hypothetical protein